MKINDKCIACNGTGKQVDEKENKYTDIPCSLCLGLSEEAKKLLDGFVDLINKNK